jgi:hypothetical protein
LNFSIFQALNIQVGAHGKMQTGCFLPWIEESKTIV